MDTNKFGDSRGQFTGMSTSFISPQIVPLPVLVQPQPIVKRVITKNYVDKLRLVIQSGNICQKCRSWERVDDLTLDHIAPKFLCHKTHYNSDSNKQLLCGTCHKRKSKQENNFLSRMTRRMIEEIHHRNNTIIDVTDIVQEYRDSVKQEQERVWQIRVEEEEVQLISPILTQLPQPIRV